MRGDVQAPTLQLSAGGYVPGRGSEPAQRASEHNAQEMQKLGRHPSEMCPPRAHPDVDLVLLERADDVRLRGGRKK